uniref:Hexosyltransferase n=1 Tax=Megaselia scalaris TaxID=36166 RepID=T1GTC7_MEGSC
MFTRRLQFLLKCTLVLGAFVLIVIIFKNGIQDSEEIAETQFYAENVHVQFIENTHKVNTNDLFNLKSFQHRITPRKECESFQHEKLAVMLVMSYVGHDDLRAAHRLALMEESLNALGILRHSRQGKVHFPSQIDDESSRFGDILQGKFVDAYRNLTYKHMMGLKWAADHCGQFKYVIKVDDDIVFDLYKLRDYLEMGVHGGKFMAGFVLENQAVVRNSQSKWM